ncbi:MAG: NADH-quinone oxidoreductase subunit NuoH [Dehalococcoidia bacterium]|nr:NADH-quinone oxidoreductase subunit NuoH [Dehalococcoidia bacterium]
MLSVLVEAVIKSGVMALVILMVCAYMTLLERRLVARFQLRYGPVRVGPNGLLQPLADAAKLIFKENFRPAGADLLVYWIAPAISMVTALFVYAVIPFGPEVTVFGRTVPPYVADVNIGILVVLGASSVGVYGIILGGWSANNKYALLGCLRSSAQVISYELALGLAVVSVVLTAGSLSLVDIVNAQQRLWFVALQPVGFVLFLVAAIAETNRAPFDLPEAEQELIAGFHTEYGGFKFAMFYVGEYVGIVTMSLLASTLFLGGWHGPVLPGPIWVAVKTLAFAFFAVWLRATLPRVRQDQLMALSWKVLIEIGFLNLLVTAAVLAWRGG